MTSMPILPPLAVQPEWFDAMSVRTSRRSYAGVPLTDTQAQELSTLADALSKVAPGVRVVFVNRQVDDVFSGIVGSYGVVIQDAPAFAVFIGGGERVASDLTGSSDPERTPMYSDVDLGRVGEAFVLHATSLGLGTCWVAGSFDRAKTGRYVDLAPGETVRAVTPVGEPAVREGVVQQAMQRLIRARARLGLDVIAPGVESWPVSARAVAEAVRIAPSGKNGQPWRMRLDGESLVLAHPTDQTLIATYMADLGIALLHAEVALDREGIVGTWRYGHQAPSGEVARFTPEVGW